MTDLSRREALGLLMAVPLGVAFDGAALARAWRAVAAARAAGAQFRPRFFTAHEWQTVRLLADIVLPRDGRSGSATDASVPEFMDFVMTDRPSAQAPMRSGLTWLDAECGRRFAQTFVACTDAQRSLVLDDIAWPARARPEMADGLAFFNQFRDLVASGFWSSRIGVEDLQYLGNTYVTEWTGCPDEQLLRLGLDPERPR